MANLSIICSNFLTSPPTLPIWPQPSPGVVKQGADQRVVTTNFAAKSGGFFIDSILKRCEPCGGKGAIDCPGCKGTGRNKKNGNIFERWKCFDCQGFGLKSCPSCRRGGLTPEQRGER